ncbi:MAG: MFS transporter, partial [Acetatifactor sp.]|nr:MFS transporter [Acetatifactor sp.]
VLGTMLIPLCNLLGVSAASMAARRLGDDEVKVAQLFYAVSCGALLVLWLGGDKSGVLALALLALSTTCMMAVNTMLISVLPAKYAAQGKTSGVSGILNSCVYAGSSASTYGIGALSATAGWKLTILLWVFGAAAAWGICLLCRLWRKKQK